MNHYYERDGITIYHGNCSDVLPHVSADVIVTDPPYGTGGWRRNESGAGSNPSAVLVREDWDDGAVDWLRLTAAPVVAFWPAAHAEKLLVAASATGRVKHRTLYMKKLDPKPQVGGRTKWSIEPIWVMSADGFVLVGGEDITESSTPRLGRDRDATGHPYQKPESVMVWLVSKLPSHCSVIDPFMGSGTTLVAAKRLGRRAVGVEAEEKWCEIAAKRLEQGTLPMEFAV
jgi:site-specific DNA-methyltransferase (adenine-specific)